jgi:teichoic acid transport system ATP-binding protein
MNDIAISVKNLSKKYRLYDSPMHRLKEALNPFRKNYHRDFWALRDINLEIPKGTTFGIIGRNGAGKSTLLQIICGILQPTVGSVQVNGRISALLELGSGFNKQYTGRENVFMQGTIMGISRGEMEKRFDQIAKFAEIGQFIDQPVKTYSSGMYTRLGFAVAIHIDPEILIIDEALSVGDMAFQNKCYSKIKSFVSEGKTALFVSHALPLVRLFCEKSLWIHSGEVQAFDTTEVVTAEYEKYINATTLLTATADKQVNPVFASGFYKDKGERARDTHAWIDDIRILNSRNVQSAAFVTGERMKIQIGVTNGYDGPLHISMGVAFVSPTGSDVCRINNIRDDKPIEIGFGSTVIELDIPSLPLLTGEYLLSFYLAKSNIAELFHKVENLLKIEVSTPFSACGWRRYDGIIAINHNWKSAKW